MWEEIASGQTDGQRLTNYYIDDKKMYKRKKKNIFANLDVLAIPCECQNKMVSYRVLSYPKKKRTPHLLNSSDNIDAISYIPCFINYHYITDETEINIIVIIK